MVQGAGDGVDMAVVGYRFRVSGFRIDRGVRNQVSGVGCQVSVFAFLFPDT